MILLFIFMLLILCCMICCMRKDVYILKLISICFSFSIILNQNADLEGFAVISSEFSRILE